MADNKERFQSHFRVAVNNRLRIKQQESTFSSGSAGQSAATPIPGEPYRLPRIDSPSLSTYPGPWRYFDILLASRDMNRSEEGPGSWDLALSTENFYEENDFLEAVLPFEAAPALEAAPLFEGGPLLEDAQKVGPPSPATLKALSVNLVQELYTDPATQEPEGPQEFQGAPETEESIPQPQNDEEEAESSSSFSDPTPEVLYQSLEENFSQGHSQTVDQFVDQTVERVRYSGFKSAENAFNALIADFSAGSSTPVYLLAADFLVAVQQSWPSIEQGLQNDQPLYNPGAGLQQAQEEASEHRQQVEQQTETERPETEFEFGSTGDAGQGTGAHYIKTFNLFESLYVNLHIDYVIQPLFRQIWRSIDYVVKPLFRQILFLQLTNLLLAKQLTPFQGVSRVVISIIKPLYVEPKSNTIFTLDHMGEI